MPVPVQQPQYMIYSGEADKHLKYSSAPTYPIRTKIVGSSSHCQLIKIYAKDVHSLSPTDLEGISIEIMSISIDNCSNISL